MSTALLHFLLIVIYLLSKQGAFFFSFFFPPPFPILFTIYYLFIYFTQAAPIRILCIIGSRLFHVLHHLKKKTSLWLWIFLHVPLGHKRPLYKDRQCQRVWRWRKRWVRDGLCTEGLPVSWLQLFIQKWQPHFGPPCGTALCWEGRGKNECTHTQTHTHDQCFTHGRGMHLCLEKFFLHLNSEIVAVPAFQRYNLTCT